MEVVRQGSWVSACVYVGDGKVKDQGQRSQAGPEATALSQGLLLWLLLSAGGVRTSRGPLRPLCRPINATLAAENEACPVCITFTTSICAGYCPSMVSCPRQEGTSPAVLRTGAAPQCQDGSLRARPQETGCGSGVGRWAAPRAGAGELESELDVWEGRAQRVPWTPESGICGGQRGDPGRAWHLTDTHASPTPSVDCRCVCCLPPCRLCPNRCAPTVS